LRWAAGLLVMIAMIVVVVWVVVAVDRGTHMQQL
jgi:hypothetical protein